MRILFDCDETLVDLIAVILQDNGGVTREMLNTRDIGGLLGIPIEQWLTDLIKMDVLERCTQYPHTAPTLNELAVRGHYMEVITNRGFHPNAHAITQMNVSGLPVSNIHIVPFDMHKADFIAQHIGYCDVFVDDSASQCNAVAYAGVAGHIFMPSHPHNEFADLHHSVVRIPDISALLEHPGL